MSNYFLFSSTTMEPCTLTKNFYREARKIWLCAECGNSRGERAAVDLYVEEENPDNTPLNMVSGCAVGIAQKTFLFGFGESLVRQHFYLGRLFGPDESLLEDWVTFVGLHRIIVRGSKNAAARRCSECRSIVYFAMEEHYLYPRPREDVAMFHAGLSRLVVKEEFVHRINPNGWRKLDCMKLPVLDAPKDGLGDLQI